MYRSVQRRSLRVVVGLLIRTLALNRQATAWVEPQKRLSFRNLSSSSSSVYRECESGLALEEPSEAVPEAETGHTGRLSRLLVRLDAGVSATPVLQHWLEEGNSMPKNVAIGAITNLKRHRQYKRALEVADFIENRRLFEMDDTDHMYRLYLTGQVGSIEDVERCFANIPETCATERVYNQLMSCYIARGMIRQAEATFEKLKNSCHLVSALPFSQLLSLYGRLQQYDKALKLLDEMNAAKIALDTRTYNILLSLFQKRGDLDRVCTLYKDMKERDATPDSFTYSMVIKVYMDLGREEEALRLVEEMTSNGPKDPLLANDLMLAVYADQGKEKELRKVWSRIQSHTNVSARSYGVMIESLGKLGLIEEAEDLANNAERKRGRLVARIFNALLYVYSRHGRMQAAEGLMLRIVKDRLRPTTVTYGHLILGYLKIDQLDKALEYLKVSRESLSYDHSKPWMVSFLQVLDYVAERGEIELAENIFETFTAAGSYRSPVVYKTLLKVYLKSNRGAKDFLQRMSEDGLQPDAETLTMLAQIQPLSVN